MISKTRSYFMKICSKPETERNNFVTDKKIVFYLGSLYKGGAERVVTNLAAYFNERGCRVTVVTKLKESVEYSLPAGVERVLADITKEEEKGRLYNLLLRIKKLRRILVDINPDIVVSFIGKNNLMSIAATRGTGIPVVVSVRSDPAREIGNGIKKALTFFMFQLADGLVLQTTQALKFFPRRIQKKAIILQNSINPQFVRTAYDGERRKEIVSVGRIDSNKNQIMLIEAFAQLAKEFAEWNVVFYGEGPQRIQCEDRVKELNLEDRILFKGVCEDIPEKIEGASVFVLPSKQEGMPNALIEAMVLGLAVISTDCPCGGPRDLIVAGENGILVPVDDIDELRKALYQLMKEETIREEMGRNARALIDRVRPEYINMGWENYLKSVIEGSKLSKS